MHTPGAGARPAAPGIAAVRRAAAVAAMPALDDARARVERAEQRVRVQLADGEVEREVERAFGCEVGHEVGDGAEGCEQPVLHGH